MLEDYHGIAQLKQEGVPYCEADPIVGKVYIGPRSAKTFADGSHFLNGSNMTAEILLHESGGKTVNYLESIRPASYPPVPQIKQPEAITATEAAQWMRENGGIRELQAKIKAKDETIAKLQADNARLNQALWDALDIDGSVIRQNKELAAKLDQAEEESRNLHDALMAANEALDMQTAETMACMERIKQLEAELASLRPAKPNTRDMSRLGHFGESHAKNGLSLFDRYF